MTENFEEVETSKLKIIQIGLEAYLQGCIDTLKIIQAIAIPTKKLYETKIQQIETILNKRGE